MITVPKIRNDDVKQALCIQTALLNEAIE